MAAGSSKPRKLDGWRTLSSPEKAKLQRCDSTLLNSHPALLSKFIGAVSDRRFVSHAMTMTVFPVLRLLGVGCIMSRHETLHTFTTGYFSRFELLRMSGEPREGGDLNRSGRAQRGLF